MDSSTQKLKDMIQRMTELDTPEEKKQQLDEMVSMNVSMSGESAEDVAALAKILGNAGVNDAPPAPTQSMPMRQDMERLNKIVSDPSNESCDVCGGDHDGPCSETEDLAESDISGKEEAIKAWYKKYSKYKNDEGKPLPAGLIDFHIDSGAFEAAMDYNELQNAYRKLNINPEEDSLTDEQIDRIYQLSPVSSKMVSELSSIVNGYVDEELMTQIDNLIQGESSNEQVEDIRKLSGLQSGNLAEWSSQDADLLKRLHGLVQSAANGDRRAGAQFEDYVDNNYPNVDSEKLLAKLVNMSDRNQFGALHDMMTSEYQSDGDDDYTDQSMRKGEMGMEGYDNEPEEDYQDTDYMTKDLAGGISRKKNMYAKSQDGDNAMSVESIKDRLYASLSEKKAKPDYADIDGDGDKKEPMKKAAKDKESKKKK